jgi:hypothetical protein
LFQLPFSPGTLIFLDPNPKRSLQYNVKMPKGKERQAVVLLMLAGRRYNEDSIETFMRETDVPTPPPLQQLRAVVEAGSTAIGVNHPANPHDMIIENSWSRPFSSSFSSVVNSHLSF